MAMELITRLTNIKRDKKESFFDANKKKSH